MDSVNRQKLQLLTEELALAKQNIMSKIGDLTEKPAVLLQLEAAFMHLKGSVAFHDEDTAKDFLHLGTSDNIQLGLQGANITAVERNGAEFPVFNTGTWNPMYGAPCLEGWNVPYYSGWKYFPYTYNRTTHQFVSLSEDSVRRRYNTPGILQGDTYTPVPLFLSARFLSFQNTSGTVVNDPVIRFTLSEDYLQGLKSICGVNAEHIDAQIYWSDNLIQNYDEINNSWTSVPNFNPVLNRTYECSTIKGENEDYTFTVGIPVTDNAWGVNKWLHIVLYWGWGYIDNIDNSDMTNNFTIGNRQVYDLSPIIWQRKNFFSKEIENETILQTTGVNNTTPVIAAINKTHYTKYDGQYDSNSEMYRYIMPFNNAIFDDVDIMGDNVVPAILCVKTGKTSDWKIVYGPQITPEFFVSEWKDCPYFPPVPQDYIAISRYIIGRTNGELYGIVENYLNRDFSDWVMRRNDLNNSPILSKTAILWMEQILPNYVTPKIQDEKLYALLSPLYQFVNDYRNLSISKVFLDAAYSIILKAASVPSNLIPNSNSITNPSSMGSIVFRNLLKNPSSDSMLDENNKKTALYFSDSARQIISDIAGLPPSTELLRFDGNSLKLTGEKINIANTLEIYQEPSSQCSVVDKNTPGTRVAQDYTLRLTLEDGSENVLIKDWYIMASKYYLTQEEYSQQAASSDGILGYFTEQTLNNIEQWRLFGYASIVPDLFMGQSRTLYTRVVAPNDSTKMTRDQFIAKNAGLSPKDLNEALLVYVEDGGEFYEPNLNQYSNKFVGIRDASMSITQYNYTTDPYWKMNLTPWTMGGRNNGTVESFSDLKADSFTIAQQGLDISQLETFGQEGDYIFTQSTGGTSIDYSEQYRAFKIMPTSSFTSNELRLHIKSTDTLTNSSDAAIEILLYSNTKDENENDIPDTQIYVGESIKYSELSDNFTDISKPFIFSFDAKDLSGQDSVYWLVLKQNAVPIGGKILIECGTDVSPSSTMYYKYDIPVTDDNFIDVIDVVTVDISPQLDSKGRIILSDGMVNGKSYNPGDVIMLNCSTSNSKYNGIYNYIAEGSNGSNKFLVRSTGATADILAKSNVYARILNIDSYIYYL